MSMLWWDLPGPGTFVQEICNELREGRNVFVFLPQHYPPGIYKAVNNLLQREGLGSLERISVRDLSNSSPAYKLHLVYDSDVHSRDNWNAGTLSDCRQFLGRIIWLDDLAEVNSETQEWLSFFKHYAHVCGNNALLERTVFCVPIVGHLTESDLPFDNLLTHNWWWNRLSFLDLQTYVANKLSESIRHPIERSTAINVITAICGYDPLCADSLCMTWSVNNDNFKDLLLDAAHERNWQNEDFVELASELEFYNPNMISDALKRPAEIFLGAWSKGMLDMVDGRLFLHPAASALTDGNKEINQRVWRGQVQTLLPIVDEYRIKIIKYLTDNHRYDPQKMNSDNNVSIVEIGTVKYHVETNKNLRKKIDKDILHLIRTLHKIRNDLAHLNTITQDRIRKLLNLISKTF